MSQNFNSKGYEDYFKVLEKKLENEAAKPQEIRRKVTNKRKSKGVFKVVRLRKSFLACVALVLVVVIGAVVVSAGKKDVDSETDYSADQTQENVQDEPKKVISYEFGKDTADLLANNDAKCGIVVNKSTNTVVAARNAHTKAYPASTTKIMTLLVAVENLKDMNKTFTMTLDITDPLFVAEASVAGFLNGETIGMTDLLYGAILPSGADASMALAITVAGSEEAFVKLMNKKVEELGLKNTHFDNVTGLHSENNYSTAYDMAVILDAALSNELCRKVLSTYQYTTSVTPEHPEGIPLSSTLFEYMYGTEPETATILGGKTGFVNESGYCIASYGKANDTDNEYIVVTLGNSARWPAFYGQIDLYKELAK